MSTTKSDKCAGKTIIIIVIDGDPNMMKDIAKKYHDFNIKFSTEDDTVVACDDELTVLRIFYTAKDFLNIQDMSIVSTMLEVIARSNGINGEPPRINVELDSYGPDDQNMFITKLALQEKFDRIAAILINYKR